MLNLPLQPKHKNGPKHSDEYPHMSRMIESQFWEVAPFHALQSTHLCSSNELANPYEQLDVLRNFDLSPIPKNKKNICSSYEMRNVHYKRWTH